MKMLKQFLATAMLVGFAAAMPIPASADHMTGYGHMGPGMGYGQMGPGMMGPGMMGPGMMGPGMMGPGMMGPGMMGPGMMGGYGMSPGMMGGCGMGPGMMGPGTMGPGMMGGYSAGPQSPLNLSAEQQTKIGEIQSEVRTKHFELMTQMQAAQLRLRDLYYSDKRDQPAINEQYKTVNQLHQQMWDGMADAQKRMDVVLTKEQRDTMRRWGGRQMMWGW